MAEKCQIIEYVYSDGSTITKHDLCTDSGKRRRGGSRAGEGEAKRLVKQPERTWWHPDGYALRHVPAKTEVVDGEIRVQHSRLEPYFGVVLVEVRGTGSHEIES